MLGIVLPHPQMTGSGDLIVLWRSAAVSKRNQRQIAVIDGEKKQSIDFRGLDSPRQDLDDGEEVTI